MLYLFIGILIIITTALFGGLLYLVYLPFKKRLIRAGRFTEKLSRQIRWAFVISLCLMGFALYRIVNYRTPSQERLEKRANILLPSDFEVLKEEFQDMGRDYTLLYDVQLSNRSATELSQGIRKSKFYNSQYLYNGTLSEDEYIVADSVKAVWCRSPEGYKFFRQGKNISYHVTLDTVTNILNYVEYSY